MVAVVALALSRLLRLGTMTLPGMQDPEALSRFGEAPEQVHRLLWGSSAMLLACALVFAVAVSLRAWMRPVDPRKAWIERGHPVISVFVAGCAGWYFSRGPGSEFAPQTLGRFYELMLQAQQIPLQALTERGNGFVAFSCVLLVCALSFLLLPGSPRDVDDLRRRARDVRQLFFTSSAVLILGLIEISLLHSWPSTVVEPEAANQIQANALAVAVVGGVFFGLLLLTFFGLAFWILGRQLHGLASVQLGDMAPRELRTRWVQESGVEVTNWDKVWRVVGILAPLLSATSVTSLVQLLSRVVVP